MNATILSSFLMGGGALLLAIYSIATGIRDRRIAKREREQHIEQGEEEIDLTKEQKRQVRQEAAQTWTEERIKIETWWKDQFDAVKEENKDIRAELAIEQRWRRRVTQYIREHTPWDEMAYRQMQAAGMDISPPPRLNVDEVDR